MSTTTLNPLQKEAIALLASGKTPQFVRDSLALATSTFETWRQSDEFVAEVERQRELVNAKATAEQETATTKAAADAFESASAELFS